VISFQGTANAGASKWQYRSVVDSRLCPRISFSTNGLCLVASAISVAYECRKECAVSFRPSSSFLRMPALLRIRAKSRGEFGSGPNTCGPSTKAICRSSNGTSSSGSGRMRTFPSVPDRFFAERIVTRRPARSTSAFSKAT
jgi:hypothetical protein